MAQVYRSGTDASAGEAETYLVTPQGIKNMLQKQLGWLWCDIFGAGTNVREMQGIQIWKVNTERGTISLPPPKCSVLLDYDCA